MSNMRVASNSVHESLIRQLNINQRTLVNLQTQLSSGRKVTLPEDDPSVMGRTLRRETQKSELSQYYTNNILAEGIVNTSQLHLEEIRNMADLAIGVADSTGPDSTNVEIDGFHQQLEEILNQAIDLANGKMDGEYLFAGVSYTTPPYSINDGGTPNDPSDDTIDYNGSPTDRTDPLFDEAEIHVGQNTKLAARLNPEHNEDIQDMLQSLLDMRNAYDTSIAPFDESTVRAITADVEAADDQLVIASSDLVTKQMRLDLARRADSSLYNQLDASIATDVAADLTSLAMQVKQTETAYQAALVTASNLMNISLLDYV